MTRKEYNTARILDAEKNEALTQLINTCSDVGREGLRDDVVKLISRYNELDNRVEALFND